MNRDRSSFNSTDAALYNIMAFQCVGYIKSIPSTWDYDQQSNFDQIWPEMSNNVAMINDSEPGQLDCRVSV